MLYLADLVADQVVYFFDRFEEKRIKRRLEEIEREKQQEQE